MEDIALFNKTSFDCSKVITQSYSTSFSIGIKLLDEKYHRSIYAIYSFFRFTDEIVDTFLDSGRKKLLGKFKSDTYEAINNGLSFNPVLHAFQLVVKEYNIEMDLIEAFFRSMEMDTQMNKYDRFKYDEYIHGSAEVVGLMCLRIFCKEDDTLYLRLKEPASKLGSALQKINFLRDIKSDYETRGRVYFPDMDYNNFDENSKATIEKDIEADLNHAALGIHELPDEARSGVQMTYYLYKKLFEKIKRLSPQNLKQKRVRISKLSVIISEKFLYFWINITIIFIPFVYSFESTVNFFSKWKSFVPAIFLTTIFFMIWDVSFTNAKIWKFNSRYLIGIKKFGIPIEEWMFFLTVPYSCIFLHEALKYYFPRDFFYYVAKPFFILLTFMIIVIGIFNNKTYTRVNSAVAVGIILIHYYIFEVRLLGRFLFSLIIHYIPFFIFNGILTGGFGMHEPIVLYNENEKINYRIGSIPIEDTIYSLSLLFMNLSLFEIFSENLFTQFLKVE